MLFRYSRLSRRVPVALTRAFSQPVRHIRQERGPKNFSEALKEMFQSMMGGFTFRGAAEDFINDVKYITGPASNFTDAIKPLRIDTSKKMTRFSKIHSDSEYGGKSFCSSRILQDDDVPSTENATSEDNSFVRFQGELNFPENKDAKIKTSGFCAAQAVCRKVLDLVDYEGVEIIVRSKEARSYILGMKTMSLSMLNDMQYQIKLDVPGGDDWIKFQIPWPYFSLTRGGRLCEIQRVNDNMQLESITFLVTKEQGPFQLDIKSVVVHPFLDKAHVQKMLPFKKGEYGNKGRSYR